MNNDSSVSQQLLAALGQHLKTDLQPDNGVCALFNSQNQEMCVIEFSPHNSHALLHCAIGGRCMPLIDTASYSNSIFNPTNCSVAGWRSMRMMSCAYARNALWRF